MHQGSLTMGTSYCHLSNHGNLNSQKLPSAGGIRWPWCSVRLLSLELSHKVLFGCKGTMNHSYKMGGSIFSKVWALNFTNQSAIRSPYFLALVKSILSPYLSANTSSSQGVLCVVSGTCHITSHDQTIPLKWPRLSFLDLNSSALSCHIHLGKMNEWRATQKKKKSLILVSSQLISRDLRWREPSDEGYLASSLELHLSRFAF